MSDQAPPPPPPPFPPPPFPPPPFSPPPNDVAAPSARRSRLPLVLAAVVGMVLIATAVTESLLDDDEAVAKIVAKKSGSEVNLDGVVTFTDLPSGHVTETVDYDTLPPAGGEHFAVWLDCGVYDEPVRDEFVVHDLEHGTFWFTYDADALDADEVATLAAALPDNGVMTPYVGLGSPAVVTVWGTHLALDGVDDPRLALFLDEYAGGVTAPEPFASCAGGASPAEISDLALPTDVTAG